jgi:hypothetical protein
MQKYRLVLNSTTAADSLFEIDKNAIISTSSRPHLSAIGAISSFGIAQFEI